MKIAIIGAGNVGSTLGKGWSAKGNEVVYGVRTPEGTHEATPAEAVKNAEVVVFALPYSALVPVAKDLNLDRKVLVDCTNPINADFSGLANIPTSAAEELAQATGSTKVVKAFNTVGNNIMADPTFKGRSATMLICGDDAAAKEIVSSLASDLGFSPLEAGPLSQARYFEALAWLWISLALKQGQGRETAFIYEKR